MTSTYITQIKTYFLSEATGSLAGPTVRQVMRRK